ncbi:hypothetical protein LCGC14_2124680 [marine sediment metagenome]|uniref:Uncharacterized protein n=1 Tax=marine sediment metagenome TaxID=412755 RepID=A0A0F9GGB0_9ZZZZ
MSKKKSRSKSKSNSKPKSTGRTCFHYVVSKKKKPESGPQETLVYAYIKKSKRPVSVFDISSGFTQKTLGTKKQTVKNVVNFYLGKFNRLGLTTRAKAPVHA